jgi:hypothetical protein
VARFSELLGERRLPVLQIASQYRELGEAASVAMKPAVAPVKPVGPPPIPQSTMYYVAVNGQQTGPFQIDALRKNVVDGSPTRETLVWHDGMAQWASASELPDIAKLFA